jgi:hypothetical protein
MPNLNSSRLFFNETNSIVPRLVMFLTQNKSKLIKLFFQQNETLCKTLHSIIRYFKAAESPYILPAQRCIERVNKGDKSK